MLRLLFLLLGHALLGLAIIGVLLPGLPTTPFLILACVCYGRSSEKFQRFLLNNRWSGPPLHNWLHNRSISRRAKVMAVSVLVVTIAYSMAIVPILAVQVGLVLIAVGVAGYIVTRPAPGAGPYPDAANPKG